MRCIDIPQKTRTIILERTGVSYTLHEFPVKHRLKCNISKDYDTPQNAILASSDIPNDVVEQLGEDELLDIYIHSLELSYPGILKDINNFKEVPKDANKLYTQAVISLMRNGHQHVFEYPVSFFNECIEELNAYDVESIKKMSIAVRGANLEDFKGFLDSFDKEEDLHKKNIELLKKDKKV